MESLKRLKKLLLEIEQSLREKQKLKYKSVLKKGSVDAEMADKWQVKGETTLKREQQSQEKALELKRELERQREEMKTRMKQLHKLKDRGMRCRYASCAIDPSSGFRQT